MTHLVVLLRRFHMRHVYEVCLLGDSDIGMCVRLEFKNSKLVCVGFFICRVVHAPWQFSLTLLACFKRTDPVRVYGTIRSTATVQKYHQKPTRVYNLLQTGRTILYDKHAKAQSEDHEKYEPDKGDKSQWIPESYKEAIMMIGLPLGGGGVWGTLDK